jgi:hypothetical protein
MPDRGLTGRSHSGQTVDDALIAVSRAIELASASSLSAEHLKASIRALCGEAKRVGMPVEALIIGLRDQSENGKPLLSIVDDPREKVRRNAVTYLIETYYADGH